MNPRYAYSILVLLTLCIVGRADPVSASADSVPSTQWGFAEPEMFPIESQIEFLQSGDLDHDGRMDLILSNPRRSEIALLFNQTGKEPSSDQAETSALSFTEPSVNDLPSDARFSMESVLVQSRVTGLHVADLDGDQLPELVTYDAKNELIIRWNHAEHPWSEQLDWRLEGGLTGHRVLQSADVNQDGLADVILIGERWLAMLLNTGEQRFDQPQKIRLPSGFSEFSVMDLNGDDAADLVFHAPGREDGLLVSLRQNQAFSSLNQIASPSLSHVQWLPRQKDDVLNAVGISDQRNQVLGLQMNLSEMKGADEPVFPSRSHYLKFPEFGGLKRGICWSDLNGDDQPDCLVADPDAGLIHVYLSNKQGGWEQSRTFPSLTGIQELVSFDWNGDGAQEVFVLSKDENQVGVSRWHASKQSLSYPERVPGLSNPLVMTIAEPHETGGHRRLAVMFEKEKGWGLTQMDDQFQQITQTFDTKPGGKPERLMTHDMDQDGRFDFLVFTPYEPLTCLRQDAEGATFELIDLPLPGGTWQRGWANRGDLNADGIPDLILPFNNLIRAFKMAPVQNAPSSDSASTQWELQVVQQINGPTGNSYLLSGLLTPGLRDQGAKVFLLDESGNQLHMAHQDSMGVWRIQESMKLFTESGDQLSLLATSEKGAGHRILCQGKQDAIVLDLAVAQPELLSLHSIRSETKDARYLQVYAADFNSDERWEVFGLESRGHAVECIGWTPQNTLEALSRWQVFESRSYRNQGAAFPEPREGLIQDVTGDGLLDFCLLVHDRIILYPQRNSWDTHPSGP